MAKAAKPIPEGFHSVTPYLALKGAAEAIEFYKRAFGAEEVMRMPGPDGRTLMHAEIKIGDSMIMLADEWPDTGCVSPKTAKVVTGSLHIYVNDVDAAFKRALGAGAVAVMPVTDMFWGDRYGKVKDPFGHVWGLATHKEDVAPDALEKRAKAWIAQMSKPE